MTVVEPLKELEEQKQRIEQLEKELAEKNDIISYYRGNEVEIRNVIKNKNKEISRLMIEVEKLKEELEKRELYETK